MSHPCGHPIAGGRLCRQPVADPSASDCGRHRSALDRIEDVPIIPNGRGCDVRELSPGVWRCLVHHGGEWEAAEALGFSITCQIDSNKARRLVHSESPLDPGTAHLLAHDPRLSVQEQLASRRDTPPEVLRRLCASDWEIVRSAAANNPCTPPDALRKLWCRRGTGTDLPLSDRLANNPTTPPDVLEELARHPNEIIRYDVSRNQNLPDALVQQLASDPSAAVRAGVARRSHRYPYTLLRRLAHDPNEMVRAAAADNFATPTDVLERLMADPEERVWQVAATAYARRRSRLDHVELGP